MNYRLLLWLALWLASGSSWAQEIRVVDGRKYMVHTVEAGQTLYAIGRTYAVPVPDLVQANPGSADGLTIGRELLVPQDAVVRRELKKAPEFGEDGELIHTVRKKETLFGIARSYGIEMNALLERNPQAIELQPDMTLVIPMEKVNGPSISSLRPAAPDSIVIHTVKQGETLYSLSKRFGVEVVDIQAANDGLAAGLKTGDEIRIPGPAVLIKPKPILPPVNTDKFLGQRYNIALALPFSVERNDSVLARRSGDEVPRYYEATRIAAQFHNGALIAIDSMQRMGLNADIAVFDMGDDSRTWSSVMKRPDMKPVDLFIGPFNRSAIEQLAKVNTKAHIVCPVPQSTKVILGYPNVSKITPTRTDLVKQSARYVAARHARDNIILAKPDIAAEKDVQDQVEATLNSALVKQLSRLRDTVTVARPGRRDLGNLPNKLDATKLNVVVAPSEDIEFVTNLVGKLKGLSTKYRIVLVGMESWTTLESVAASDLDQLSFLFAAGSFTDLSDPATIAFVKRYRERFKTDADDYALLGFDVTLYYLKALMSQGNGFADRFDLVHTTPLHMGFRMTSTGPENGFRNEFAIMLQQKDLKLVKVQ